MDGESAAKPGDVVGGKYVIDAVLGEGGMGVVLSARHKIMGNRVALKFMQAAEARDPLLCARFEQEARASVSLKGEHVARVIDVDRWEGRPFIVMEHLEGRDLAAVLAEQKRMRISDACDMILQAIEALAEAHAQGIVHRDVKPANMFLTRTVDGRPLLKVLDFGLAKIKRDPQADDGSLTHSSAAFGSPYYMAPEQMRSARVVDHRADIWSLGVSLYELLAGSCPFEGETPPEIFAAVLSDAPQPITKHRDDIPPALAAAIDRCLQKDPVARFESVAELASAIEPFGGARAAGSSQRIRAILHVDDESTPSTLPENPRPESVRDRSLATASTWTAVSEESRPEEARDKVVATGSAWSTGSGRARQGRRSLVLSVVIGGVLVAGGSAVALKLVGRSVTPPPPTSVPAAITAPSHEAVTEPLPSASATASPSVARPVPASPSSSALPAPSSALRPATKPTAGRHVPNGGAPIASIAPTVSAPAARVASPPPTAPAPQTKPLELSPEKF